jgi:hypothetical protein
MFARDQVDLNSGDELLCAMPNLGVREARARFEKIAAVLAAADADHSFTVGLAEGRARRRSPRTDRLRGRRFLQARHSPTSDD